MLNSAGPVANASLWITTSGVGTYVLGQTTWQFSCRYSAAPSNSNNMRVYLVSNHANPNLAEEGYYIQLGESGSGDGVDLFKVGASDPIIEDPGNTVADSINLTLKVVRENDGSWLLYANESEGASFRLIGKGFDDAPAAGDYFGLQVNHTSTRRNNFFFDDLSVTIMDNLPPAILGVEALNVNKIIVRFSEPLSLASINVDNFNINNDTARPFKVGFKDERQTVLQLEFADSFRSGIPQTLTVSNISDHLGNTSDFQNIDFIYYLDVTWQWRDVRMTEIMPNPGSLNIFPEAEYIEIFNSSTNVISLAGWSVRDLSRLSYLKDDFIFPGEYMILCDESQATNFAKIGKTQGINRFPSLNNAEDIIVIKDDEGVTIDSIHYSEAWYRSVLKRDGGWSLEVIDPFNICEEEQNWTASENDNGGTPGARNSVFAEKPDLFGPEIKEVLAFHPDSILVVMDEILDVSSVLTATYTTQPNLAISEVLVQENLKELILLPQNALSSGVSYNITINGLRDCPGNIIDPMPFRFALLDTAKVGDIVLNELLFNPRIGGVDFVEVYNTSQKYVDLKGWSMGNFEYDSLGLPMAVNLKSLGSSNNSIAPHSFTVFTTDQANLAVQYLLPEPGNIIQVAGLPSFPDDKGSVAIIDASGTLHDHFEYQEDFHFELLDNHEGVSLERVTPVRPTNLSSNWKSAASTVGYATPGYQNSQSRDNPVLASGNVAINPKVIIPDGSGRNEFATITYQFDAPGYVANVRIFDLHGREIFVLAQNDLLSSSGTYTWEGVNAKGVKVRTGYYIVFFEVFNNQGDVRTFKEKLVVGARF